jgi:hypothetical protein
MKKKEKMRLKAGTGNQAGNHGSPHPSSRGNSISLRPIIAAPPQKIEANTLPSTSKMN